MSGFKSEATSAGDKYTSGNGSIMRLAPLPIFYHDADTSLLSSQAQKQSKTTHQGMEASDCCKILAFVVASAIRKGEQLEELFQEEKETSVAKIFLDSLDFSIVLPFLETQGGKHLALSKCVDFDTWIEDKFNKLENDKNWDWKDSEEDCFSPTRRMQNPGYFGSYAMDGLKIALYCVYHTSSYEECMLKVINWKGDSDTTGAITGQMAGAIYGVARIPNEAKHLILKWDNNGEIPLRAFKLFNNSLIEKVQ